MEAARRSTKDGGSRGEVGKDILGGKTRTGDGIYPAEI